MTKEEYMEQLRTKLKRLPKEDFIKAIEYFEEYFAEAGEENTTQAIEDLGSPQEAADQIIREVAIDHGKSGEAKKDVRKGINGVWVVILAIFASPIALPFIFAAVVMLLALLIVVILFLAAIGLSGVAFVVSAPITLIGAVMMIPHSIPVALVCAGIGLTSMALGVLIVYASYLWVRKFLYWVVLTFSKKFAKGGKKSEVE